MRCTIYLGILCACLSMLGCPQQPGGSSLSVSIMPAEAVAAGAQWNVDGGAWQACEAVCQMAPGSHTVSFTDLAGWVKPPDKTAVIASGQATTSTGIYTALGATSLVVNIGPGDAVSAGAQWQLDGGAWQNSGAILSPVSAGNHTVSFKDVAGWANPGSRTVAVLAGQTTAIAADYRSLAETGVVMGMIEPEGARTAFGQWRVDDGVWHQSGESVLGIPVGKHLVSFSDAPGWPGWIKPVSIPIDVSTDPTVVITGTYTPLLASDRLLVLGYNDLGMHCMNMDFSEFMILPPYNTLHAQVIDRSGPKPRFVQDGVTVSYGFPSNTTSVTKTNFWDFAQDLFGLDNPLAADIGLAGNGLSGTMTSLASEGRTDWSVLGIPLTPILDDGTINSFQLALITVSQGGNDVVQTQAVAPVSWEIRCDYCHTTPGISVGQDILLKHDRMTGTTLAFPSRKPVVCGNCHPQPELGLTGDEGMATLSSSMHTAHAKRMWLAEDKVEVGCYACHPGEQTRCMRDVHHLGGMICTDCHGGMADVGNPARRPWQDEPRCGTCHQRAGFEFEQPDTLFRNSRGHYGVQCEACHGSPHAITPTSQPADNIQAMAVQGRQGPIKDCTVCHSDPTTGVVFEHRYVAPSL